MAPKKGKGKGKKKKEPVSMIIEAPSHDSIPDRDVDLVNDLNDNFWISANKTVQNLINTKNLRDAARVKKFVNILSMIHRRYVEELNTNQILQPLVERANVKLKLALELISNSEEAMERLREVLGESWRETDASQLREQDIQEKLHKLMIKCIKFEDKDAQKQDDSQEFGRLAKYKNTILRERDRINAELVDHEKRLQLQRYYTESLEYINKVGEESINNLTMRMRVLESERNNMELKLKNLINALDDQKDFNASTLAKLDQANRELSETQLKLTKRNMDFEKQKQKLEKTTNDKMVLSRSLIKSETEIEVMKKDRQDLEETIRELRAGEKQKTDALNQLTKSYKKSVYDHDVLSQKLYKMDRNTALLNEELIKQKNQNNALEKDVLTLSQKMEDLRRLKDYVTRERDSLRSDIVKLNNTLSDQKHTNMMQGIKIDNLHLDIHKLNKKLDEARINIAKAEKERDEMAQEVESQHEKIEYLQEQIQMKTDQVNDLTEKLAAKHAALINLKKLLEAAHSEKMMLQRALEMCTQERDNLRSIQNKSNFQMQQLSNEIALNQNKINSLNLKIENLNDEKKELETELKATRAVLASVRKELKEMKVKNDNLLKTIADDEMRFLRLSHELDDTRKDKNLIGLQMVRRNDEIFLLKERLSIVQTALDQGQVQYNQRVVDIRLLKVEISNLQTERNCLSRALKSTADMRQEIIRLERNLTEERVRSRALIEDARTPVGIHRWRILKGSQPDKFALLTKVHSLQRRNLLQEVQKAKLVQNIQEKDKVCESLKKVIESIPSSDVKKKLTLSQRSLREKEKKIKILTAELTVNQIELRARECALQSFKATTQPKQSLTERKKIIKKAENEIQSSRCP